MKISEIPWEGKQVLVFFGKDAQKRAEQICSMSKGFVDTFPETRCFHPWEHIEFLETTIKTINRHPDCHWTIITNSAYMVDHLSNLMKGARLKASKEFTLGKDDRAFIDKDRVGVYICGNGKVRNAMSKKKDDEKIEWDELSEVAEWIGDIYFDMEES